MKSCLFTFMALTALVMLVATASATVLSLESGEVTAIGSTASVNLILDEAPSGLAGFSVNVTFEDPAIGIVTGVSYPSWASLSETSALPSSDCKVRALDMGEQVQSGATNITLATLTLSATGGGSTPVNLTVNMMEDDLENLMVPVIVPGTFSVNIPGAPHAGFTSDVQSGPAPLAVQFTDQSTGNPPLTYAWDLDGDGTVDSTDKNPSFTYPVRGMYRVALTVSNGIGTSTMAKPGYIDVTGARAWTVGAEGCDYSTIHEAIENPDMDTGDSIFVYNGTYTTDGSESMTQDVSFVLEGEGPDAVAWTRPGPVALNGPGTVVEGITFIVPPGSANAPLTLAGSGSTIRDCIFEGGSDTLVAVSSPGATIERTIFRNAWLGTSSNAIYLDSASGCTIRGNAFSDLGMGDAIRVNKAGSNTIENNTFTSVWYGVRINQQASAGTHILRNTFSACNESGAAILFNSAGPDTTIFLNTFIGNGQDIRYSGTAPSGTTFISPDPITYTYQGVVRAAPLGNYWDTYSGTDADGNGIGDTIKEIRTTAPLDSDTAPLMDEVRYYFGDNAPTQAPVAAFSASPTSGTAPLSVQFTDQSTNSPTSWTWTFGDNGTSAVQNPSHQYTSPGSYTVILTATNSAGDDTEEKTGYITATGSTVPPVANFAKNTSGGAAPLAVQFTDTSTGGDPTSWAWDFENDGTIDSNEENPVFIYTVPGTYSINLTVANPGGTSSKLKENQVTVTAPSVAPVAAFTASPTSGTAPLSVQFTDQSTNSPTSWSWTFGDGGTSAVQNPSHQYNSTETFTVTLTATNSAGSDTEEKAGYITVTSGTVAPVAAFSASPTSGIAPLSVKFTDQSTNSPTSWSWTFGDGGTSAEQNPSHQYNSTGTFTVTLTATNSAGSDVEEKTGYITVSGSQPGSLLADFTATPLEGFPPLLVRFTDLSSGTITSRAWDFQDDGTIDSWEENPVALYKKPGVYSVRLDVTGPDGTESEIKEAYITVKEGTPLPAIARFTQDMRRGNSPLTVTFTDRSFNNPDTYLWSFGDGTTSSEKDPDHTYTSPGFYLVTLRVSNEKGGSSAQGYVLVWEIENPRLDVRGRL